MKELIPMNEYGVFCDNKDTPRANSITVAKMFNKKHKSVLRAIENIECSEEFNRHNFAPISYTDEMNRKQKAYAMTRDGFAFLVMGFTGKKAAQFKELYIKQFNSMEQYVRSMVASRKDFPLLTENIKLIHDEPRPYHFSNECDLLNKLITGMTAKQFREAHNIQKGDSIRPYLTAQQIQMLETLQKVDIGLLLSVPDFQQRKRHLEWYISKKFALEAGGSHASNPN